MLSVDMKVMRSQVEDYAPPGYATPNAGAMDLRAIICNPLWLEPRQTELIPTGLAFDLASSGEKIVGLLLPRSGLGHDHGLVLGNTIGLIDTDYQGELFVSMYNRSEKVYSIEPGERIAQIMFVKAEHLILNLVEEFVESERGSGGFGHSGRL